MVVVFVIHLVSQGNEMASETRILLFFAQTSAIVFYPQTALHSTFLVFNLQATIGHFALNRLHSPPPLHTHLLFSFDLEEEEEVILLCPPHSPILSVCVRACVHVQSVHSQLVASGSSSLVLCARSSTFWD